MTTPFRTVTTRTGDSGRTGGHSGKRDRKDSPLFEILGELDELNGTLGVAKHHVAAREELRVVQCSLIELCSLVATDPILAPERYEKLTPFGEDRVAFLENWKRTMLGEIELKPDPVIPGETLASGHVDLARAVCRRAERRMDGFARDTPRPDLDIGVRWLNRLSDALFVLARHAERRLPRL